MKYWFNKSTDENNRHEVHTQSCSYSPMLLNKVYIGEYNNCHEAIKAAEKMEPFKQFDGCYYCCNECHKG